MAKGDIFQTRKEQCLGKRDKSNAGRIDPHAVEICASINAREEYYTTSSCAGRCFLYRGDGIKSHHHYASDPAEETKETKDPECPCGGLGYFERFRVSHDIVRDPERYFNLETLKKDGEGYDPTGGGDPVRSVGQFDHNKMMQEERNAADGKETSSEAPRPQADDRTNRALWLRFEPFILHVSCRSLDAAQVLMDTARPAFKNVGLTTWKLPSSPQLPGKYIVAIWGDEGVDMPVCSPDGISLFTGYDKWLSQLVNERHTRNWIKIDRFVSSMREIPAFTMEMSEYSDGNNSHTITIPKSFDVIGDVALLHALPPGTDEDRKTVGEAIMSKNKAIKICAARVSALNGASCSPGDEGITILAGTNRSPLLTTHTEYGIKCIVDIRHCFFSPRMGIERLRLCNSIARGEKVLVLFAGCGMEALQIAGRTEASRVIAVEKNVIAVECARRGQKLLARNKTLKCLHAAERLSIMEGDVLDICPQLEYGTFDRILAPRPKEGKLDGDLGTGDHGLLFLEALLPLLKGTGGECHWYDFAADHEFPECKRTRSTIEKACQRLGCAMEVIHVASVGSVAKRQLRICMDFRLLPCSSIEEKV